jgi:two-component system, LuxR family, response regulator FixJ
MTPRTVYVVDDHLDFLQSTQWWLEGAGFQVHTFSDSKKAVHCLTKPLKNACLLLDVRMPELSGLQVHDQLQSLGSCLPVVYMSGHGDVPLAVQAMQKGAIAFIEKPFAQNTLEKALELAFKAAKPSDHEPSQFKQRLAKLSPREKQVIDLVVAGKLNKTMAHLLNISIKTVELHRKNAMQKLQVKSALELMRMMVTVELSPPSSLEAHP